jgi:hypothetical protein
MSASGGKEVARERRYVADPTRASARWRANSGTWIQNDSDVAQGSAGASATG